MNGTHFLFTSESVTGGHPDKVCDQISDAVLDAVLKDDPKGRVACETFITVGLVIVGGEITTDTYVEISELARRVIRLLDSPSRVRFVEIDFSDIDVRVPRLRKAEKLLGFRPSVELDDAVLRTAEWYRENMEHVCAEAVVAEV